MKLLERLRAQPAWQSGDPMARVAALRDLEDEAGDLLIEIARHDDDASVRVAAVEQMPDLRTLVAFLREPGDDDAARTEAAAGVRETLIEASAAGAVLNDALAVLADERDIAAVARSAKTEAIARAAVARVSTEKLLASIARRAEQSGVAVSAVARIDSRDELLAVAMKTEDRAAAMAACERLTASDDELEMLARRARHKSVARWARAALDARAEPDVIPEPPGPVPDPTLGVEECRALETLATRIATLEQGRRDLDAALVRWAALDGPIVAEVSARFAAARWTIEDRLLELDHTVVEEQRAAEQQAVEAAAEAERRQAEAADADARRQAEAADADARRQAAVEAKAAQKQEARANLKRLRKLADRIAVVLEASRATDSDSTSDGAGATAGDGTKRSNAAGGVSLGEAERLLRTVRQAVAEPPPLPSRHDRDAITRRLREGVSRLSVTVRELRDFADWKRWANLGVQEELCREMERLGAPPDDAPAPDDAAVATAFTDIMKRWRMVADVPRDRGRALWERFKAAHDRVHPRCETYFAAHREAQKEGLKRRRALVEEAERLSESTDWLKTLERMTALQAEWKALGPASRREQRKLWERFRTATSIFFDRRKADLVERKAVWAENYRQKEALCERVEALRDGEDLTAAIEAVKQAQVDWKSVGPVRRTKSDAIWTRFRAACDAVFDRVREGRLRPATAAVDSTQQVERLEQLCAQAEALAPAEEPAQETAATSPAEILAREWRERLAANTMGQGAADATRRRVARDDLKRLVAERRRLGPLRGADAKALDARFQRACDRVFRDQQARAAAV